LFSYERSELEDKKYLYCGAKRLENESTLVARTFHIGGGDKGDDELK